MNLNLHLFIKQTYVWFVVCFVWAYCSLFILPSFPGNHVWDPNYATRALKCIETSSSDGSAHAFCYVGL